MKISFTFDPSVRSFCLVPDDTLETCLMEDMATLCEKGARLEVKKVIHAEGSVDSYVVEMRINGK